MSTLRFGRLNNKCCWRAAKDSWLGLIGLRAARFWLFLAVLNKFGMVLAEMQINMWN